MRRYGRHLAAMSWVVPYTDILEVSFVAFLVSGAFLGLANFDLFYQLVACTIAMKLICGHELAFERAKQDERAPSLAESEAFG